MPTYIDKINNLSKSSVIAFNFGDISNSYYVKIGLADSRLCISNHRYKPIIVATNKGYFHIWDSGFDTRGKWEDEPNERVLLSNAASGVVKHTEITIAPNGDVRMHVITEPGRRSGLFTVIKESFWYLRIDRLLGVFSCYKKMT